MGEERAQWEAAMGEARRLQSLSQTEQLEAQARPQRLGLRPVFALPSRWPACCTPSRLSGVFASPVSQLHAALLDKLAAEEAAAAAAAAAETRMAELEAEAEARS
eukprot:103545-Prymnesium_polylepis.1